MPDAHLHFPKADTGAYRATWDGRVRCAVMQGGQGDVKHWAFNDPLPRKGRHQDAPPSAEDYRKLATRTVDLHPLTIAQNARTSGGGNISMVPTKAISVGPVETWKADKVSRTRRQPREPKRPAADRVHDLQAHHRLGRADAAARRPPERAVHYFRGGLGTCAIEVHLHGGAE